MGIFQFFLGAITLLSPVFFAAACVILVWFSHRDCLRREEKSLKTVVIAFLFFAAFSWIATFCYSFFPEIFVILNVPCLIAFVLSVVFLYRIFRFLTRLGLPEDFPPVHYLVPAILVTVFLVWSLFVPFNVQVEIVKSRQLMLPGEYEAYSRLFTSKPFIRLFFQIFYLTFTCLLLVRYYRKADAEESYVRKPARWVIFLIVLFLITMLATLVMSLLPRGKTLFQIWILIAALGSSGLYVLLTYHIIRRKYLLYSLHPVTQRIRNKKTGRRVFSGELTRERLERWFREKKPYLNSEFKITDVVQAMNVNRSVVSSFINKEYGVNFNQFVNRWRLKEVERLAELSGIDAAKLYAQAGFSEARQYYRAK